MGRDGTCGDTDWVLCCRCNLVGQDLNRAWADTNLYLNAEIVEIKKKLLFYDNHPRYDLGTVYFPLSLCLN